MTERQGRMNITDDLFAQASRRPAHHAMLVAGRGVTLRAFADAVLRVEAGLAGQGVRPGSVVAIDAGGAVVQLCIAFALARLGAVQMPVSRADPAERVAALCRHAGAAFAVADAASRLPPGLPRIRIESSWLDAAAPLPPPRPAHPGGDAPWLLNVSSGTTGRPKAMHITHANEIARATRQQDPALRIEPGERLMGLIRLDFWIMRARAMRCLGDGGTLVLPPEGAGIPEMVEIVRAGRVAHLVATPGQIETVLRMLPEDPACEPRWPELRTLRIVTARLTPRVLDLASRRLTPRIYTNYGATETGNVTLAGPGLLARNPNTVGRVCGDAEIELLDDAGRRVGPGTIGHVRLRTPGMVQGYADDPDATAKAFREGWFWPGDMAAMDEEGCLFLLGRGDEVMNFDGLLVSPAEIEDVLLGHPAVAEAAAFPSARAAHLEVPMAAVVLRGTIEPEVLLHWAKERLGGRAPRRVFVVAALPRNRMGKVMRRVLAQDLSPAAPAGSQQG
jgi:acyl-coenzyme A synthetase/AMP-(fatty) acid ligase